MIYCQADKDSVRIMRKALDDFAGLSNLVINLENNLVFISGVDNEFGTSLQNLLGFRLGSLSVKYLGVPLISTRLTPSNCKPLVDWILFRIKLWTSTSLTYVGCLQLIKSVLFSIQVYWSSMFFLFCSIIKRIEGILDVFI
jgi:hypothetical protein